MPFCAMYEYPALAAKQIFEGIDALQLFELSKLSKKLESKMRKSGIRCEKHCVSFTRNPSIQLEFNKEDTLEFIFNMPFPKHVTIRTGQFKNLNCLYSAVSEKKVVICAFGVSVFKALYLFYDHVAGLFQTPMIGQLDVDVDKIKNLIGLLAIPELNHCQTLQLIGEEMEEEDAKYIQDNCQIHETLSLNGKVGRRDQHYKLYEVKNLIMKDNLWITINDLYLMKCQNIHIEGCFISDSDLIEFVQIWKNGETNTNLKTLHVEFTGNSIFDAFIPFVPTRREDPALPIDHELPNGQGVQGEQPPLVAAEIPNNPNNDDSDSDSSDDEEVQAEVRREQEAAREQQRLEQNRNRDDRALHRLEQVTPWREIERTKMDLKNHPRFYSRQDENYSKLVGEDDTIELDTFYRDIKKFDGTVSSIKIHKNTFKMVIWHDYELPPMD